MKSYVQAMRRFATFTGRACWTEFWLFGLVAALIGKAASLADLLLEGHGPGLLCIVAGLVHLVPGLAVGTRRMHDTGRTGWWIVLPTGIVCAGGALVLLLVLRDRPQSGAGLSTVLLLGVPTLIVTLFATLRLVTFLWTPGTPGPNRFGPEPGRPPTAG